MSGVAERDFDAIFNDARADRIFETMWDKVPGGEVIDFERDHELLKATLYELMALGYTKDEANNYMNENFRDY